MLLCSFDEKEPVCDSTGSLVSGHTPDIPTAVLIEPELIEDLDDEDDVYMAVDDEEEEEEEGQDGEALFDSDYDPEDEDMEGGLVMENPFEPVYPASAGILTFCDDDDNDNDNDDDDGCCNEKKSAACASTAPQGIVLEAISLDNILPEGQRRRRPA